MYELFHDGKDFNTLIPMNDLYKKHYEIYPIKECDDAGYVNYKEHNKDEDYRYIELIPDYELLKEQIRNNLLNPKGIEIKINISIHVEEIFGHIIMLSLT